MDNVTVLDLGPGATDAAGGEPVVLLGTSATRLAVRRGGARARLLGTINYEITCGISQRVPRAYRR